MFDVILYARVHHTPLAPVSSRGSGQGVTKADCPEADDQRNDRGSVVRETLVGTRAAAAPDGCCPHEETVAGTLLQAYASTLTRTRTHACTHARTDPHTRAVNEKSDLGPPYSRSVPRLRGCLRPAPPLSFGCAPHYVYCVVGACLRRQTLCEPSGRIDRRWHTCGCPSLPACGVASWGF